MNNNDQSGKGGAAAIHGSNPALIFFHVTTCVCFGTEGSMLHTILQ